MNPPFLFDVAISYVGYDALTARRLMDRLSPRLRLPVFFAGERLDESADGEHVEGVVRVLEHQARVIVVLHQRLWGDTPATRADRRAIERRMAEHGAEFLVVIPLDPAAERPSWMARAAVRENISPDGIDDAVEAIAATVRRLGGALRDPQDSESAERAERDEQTERAHDTALSSNKAVLAVRREVDAVLDEIARRAAEVRTFLPDVDLRMRRTPDRCVVQAGPVGLSVSWLPVRSDTPARGILLVIEWDGTVTLHGETQSPSRQATPVHEHVLHLAAGSSPDWRWCGEDDSMRAYSSSDLAAQCVHLLLQRLRAPAAV
jgi:hypothetical protein